MLPETIAPKRFQCRHIFTDGRRCGSPCLRTESFCYHHHTTRKPIADLRNRKGRTAAFDLPNPEDRSAIQLSIGEVLRRIAANTIDPRRAGLLLYGLQIAALNLPKQRELLPTLSTAFVEEVIADPRLGTLAPVAELSSPETQKSFTDPILEEFEDFHRIPTLQAVAASAPTSSRTRSDHRIHRAAARSTTLPPPSPRTFRTLPQASSHTLLLCAESSVTSVQSQSSPSSLKAFAVSSTAATTPPASP